MEPQRALYKSLLLIFSLSLLECGVFIVIDFSKERKEAKAHHLAALKTTYEELHKDLKQLDAFLFLLSARFSSCTSSAKISDVLKTEGRWGAPFFAVYGTLYWVTRVPGLTAISQYGAMLKFEVPPKNFLEALAQSPGHMHLIRQNNMLYFGVASPSTAVHPPGYMLLRLREDDFLAHLKSFHMPSTFFLDLEILLRENPSFQNPYGLFVEPIEQNAIRYTSYLYFKPYQLALLVHDPQAFSGRKFLGGHFHHFTLLALFGCLFGALVALHDRWGQQILSAKLAHQKVREKRYKSYIAVLLKETQQHIKQHTLYRHAHRAERRFTKLIAARYQATAEKIYEMARLIMEYFNAKAATPLQQADTITLLVHMCTDSSALSALALTNLQPARIDIHIIIRQAYEILAYECEETHVKVKRPKAEKPLYITLDEALCLLVVANLLYKAIERTPQEGAITIQAYSDDRARTVTVSIEDTGYDFNASDLIASSGGRPSVLPFLQLPWPAIENMVNTIKGELTCIYVPQKGNRMSLILPFDGAQEPGRSASNVVRLFEA